MKKKTEKLHRLVRKLSAKYGKKDEDVIRLQAELDTLVTIEQSGGKHELFATLASTGPSPAKLLYLEALRATRK